MPYSANHPITAHKSAVRPKETPPTQGFTGFTKLYELNMATSASVFEEFARYGQAVMGAQAPQEWFDLQTGLFQTLTEKFSAYFQDTCHLVESAETSFPHALGGDLSEVKKMLSGVFENAFRYTPVGAGYIPSGTKDAGDATKNLIE